MWVLLKGDVVVDTAAKPFEVHPELVWREVADGAVVQVGSVMTKDGVFEEPVEQRPEPPKPDPAEQLLTTVAKFCLGQVDRSELERVYNEALGAGKTVPIHN